MTSDDTFDPNWFSPPGDTIKDVLKERNISLNDFSIRIGLPLDSLECLLRGELKITENLADTLAREFGGSAAFWINRELQYRRSFARIHSFPISNEIVIWLNNLPLKEMIDFGWIRKFEDVHLQIVECFKFFDVTNFKSWTSKYRKIVESAAYRTSPKYLSTTGAVAAWLRRGQILSESIKCNSWDSDRFRSLLPTLRRLTRVHDPRDFMPELQRLCGEAGVAVVVARAPSDCKASGATYFSSAKKAHIQLSCRYLSDDHFWFTFFHEAGHLILHSQQSMFFEGIEAASLQEEEANRFSEDTLIPEYLKQEFMSLPLDGRKIMRFAKLADISPGIVVGQLQYYNKITRRQLNNLKRRFSWEGGSSLINHDKE
jgi:Plasmid maintenance system antidote protein